MNEAKKGDSLVILLERVASLTQEISELKKGKEKSEGISPSIDTNRARE